MPYSSATVVKNAIRALFIIWGKFGKKPTKVMSAEISKLNPLIGKMTDIPRERTIKLLE